MINYFEINARTIDNVVHDRSASCIPHVAMPRKAITSILVTRASATFITVIG